MTDKLFILRYNVFDVFYLYADPITKEAIIYV